MKKCLNCSKDNPDDAIYCMNCGKPLKAPEPSTKTCPLCSIELPLDAKFCISCGTAFTSDKNVRNKEIPKITPKPNTSRNEIASLRPTPRDAGKKNELQQSGMTRSDKKFLIWFLVISFLGICFFIQVVSVFLDNNSSSKTQTEETVLPKITNTPSNTKTPNSILKSNENYLNGTRFYITSISRFLSADEKFQNIEINYTIYNRSDSKIGFTFSANELILDLSNGKRIYADSTTNDCKVQKNDDCSSTAIFILPINESIVNLYYVSNRYSGNMEPVDITNPVLRRVIAKIDLSAMYLPPTSTFTITNTKEPTNTGTPTSIYTSTETTTPTLTPTNTRTLIPSATQIPSRTPIPPVKLSEIYANFLYKTNLQFKEYGNSIIGKKIDERVKVSNVTDTGVVSLYGPWKEDGYSYWEFCVVVLNVPKSEALDLSAGEYINLDAKINRFADDNSYFINCETTLVLSHESIND